MMHSLVLWGRVSIEIDTEYADQRQDISLRELHLTSHLRLARNFGQAHPPSTLCEIKVELQGSGQYLQIYTKSGV